MDNCNNLASSSDVNNISIHIQFLTLKNNRYITEIHSPDIIDNYQH